MQLDLSLQNFPIRARLLFVFLILGGVFSFFSYIKPLGTTREDQRHQIGALQLQVRQGQEHKKQLRALRNQLSQQRQRLQHLQRILPAKKETARMVDRLQHLAVESGLQIKSFSPQKTVLHDFYSAWPILVSLEGSYHNLGRFLELVANNLELVGIGDLTISALEDDTHRDGTIVATCTAEVFMLASTSDSPQ